MLRRGDDLLQCKTHHISLWKKLIHINQYLISNLNFGHAQISRLTPEFMTVYTFALPMNGRRPWPLR